MTNMAQEKTLTGLEALLDRVRGAVQREAKRGGKVKFSRAEDADVQRLQERSLGSAKLDAHADALLQMRSRLLKGKSRQRERDLPLPASAPDSLFTGTGKIVEKEKVGRWANNGLESSFVKDCLSPVYQSPYSKPTEPAHMTGESKPNSLQKKKGKGDRAKRQKPVELSKPNSALPIRPKEKVADAAFPLAPWEEVPEKINVDTCTRWRSFHRTQPDPELEYNTGVISKDTEKHTGQLPYSNYVRYEVWCLGLCSATFAGGMKTKCPHGSGKCTWRHWWFEERELAWLDKKWVERCRNSFTGDLHPPDHPLAGYKGIPRYMRDGVTFVEESPSLESYMAARPESKRNRWNEGPGNTLFTKSASGSNTLSVGASGVESWADAEEFEGEVILQLTPEEAEEKYQQIISKGTLTRPRGTGAPKPGNPGRGVSDRSLQRGGGPPQRGRGNHPQSGGGGPSQRGRGGPSQRGGGGPSQRGRGGPS